jgi:hypothetical protein
MGHLGSQNVARLPSIYKGINLTEKHHPLNYIYKVYLTSKGRQLLYDYPIEPGKYKIDLIYSDVVGLIPVLGYNRSRYLVTFIYDYSKLIAVYLIKAKGNIIDSFIHFKKHYKRPDLGWVIKHLRNNNRGEYIISKFQKVLFKGGIRWEPTEPYTSQINGSAKRLGRTIY